MVRNEKGDRRERELVNGLDECGWAVMRAPSSGSSTKRELPDAIAGKGGRTVVIEAKSSSGDPIYIDSEKIDGLLSFAKKFGAEPLVGARFDRCDWGFIHPPDLYRTGSGNCRVKKDVAVDALSIEEL